MSRSFLRFNARVLASAVNAGDSYYYGKYCLLLVLPHPHSDQIAGFNRDRVHCYAEIRLNRHMNDFNTLFAL